MTNYVSTYTSMYGSKGIYENTVEIIRTQVSLITTKELFFLKNKIITNTCSGNSKSGAAIHFGLQLGILFSNLS